MPAISVVLPVFNRQGSIARVLDSALAQDFGDFEIVVVDDASTDATVTVIERYADPRIVLLRQPQNRHAGAARNRGVREARSELIAFIDSDDEFLPRKLGFVVDYFQRHPEIDALIDSFEIVYPPRMHTRPRLRINPPLTDSATILEGVYARRISKATPALTARRPALLAAGLCDETLPRRQDFDLVVRLLRSCRGATTDQVLWHKHWTEGAITSQVHTFMSAILEMCRRNPEYLTTPRYRVGVARDLAHHVFKLIRKRQFALLRTDVRRFAAAHGGARTARLIGQGMIETAKRAIAGSRSQHRPRMAKAAALDYIRVVMASEPIPITPPTLPPITILIEWENAIDVEDKWTHRAMRALETELASSRDLMPVPPRVMYLYDRGRVAEELIRRTIATVAPRIPELCTLEMVPTPGLTYYKLKNFGVARTETEYVVMLDSDAAPQPGWLPGLLAPFADPEVMAVGGFTVLAYDDLLSKVLALIWIFHLRSDRHVTLKRKKINANNCAFRTEFFKANPWPDLPAFKKQCGFWLRDIERRGIKWVRTVDAMTVHAPHPGYAFFLWRAWTAGTDRDVQTYHAGYTTRLGRLGYAVFFWVKRSARSTLRILTRSHQVELRWWQMPAALLVGNLYFAVLFVGQGWGAVTRSYAPLAADRPTAADVGPSEWRTTSR